MAAPTTAAFTGIHNENEFYSHHYLSEIFSGDIRATVDRWRNLRRPRAGGRRTPRCARWPASTCGSAATSIASAAADGG